VSADGKSLPNLPVQQPIAKVDGADRWPTDVGEDEPAYAVLAGPTRHVKDRGMAANTTGKSDRAIPAVAAKWSRSGGATRLSLPTTPGPKPDQKDHAKIFAGVGAALRPDR
jgi:hypothetical protein